MQHPGPEALAEKAGQLFPEDKALDKRSQIAVMLYVVIFI